MAAYYKYPQRNHRETTFLMHPIREITEKPEIVPFRCKNLKTLYLKGKVYPVDQTLQHMKLQFLQEIARAAAFSFCPDFGAGDYFQVPVRTFVANFITATLTLSVALPDF